MNRRDWTEDENGNYHCQCVQCGHDFIGHKRRVVCRRCHHRLNGLFSQSWIMFALVLPVWCLLTLAAAVGLVAKAVADWIEDKVV